MAGEDGAYEQVRKRDKPAHGPSGFLPEGQDGTSGKEQVPRTHTCRGLTEGGMRLGLKNMQLCVGDGGRRGHSGRWTEPKQRHGVRMRTQDTGETPVRDPSWA